MFKKLLGEKGDEEQLLSFLNAVLSSPGKERLLSVEILENRTLSKGNRVRGIGYSHIRHPLPIPRSWGQGELGNG
ncbi:MAG: Rpn family recombination-promoting nuclease/putative transposase [Spirochaetaceae bacterium]|nr:Rpn family recombination-promoting nuclease/putative transposase [Spirochaetaceae bacterium]